MDTLITTVIITSGNSKNGEYVSPLGVRYEHGKHNYHHHHHYNPDPTYKPRYWIKLQDD